MDEGKHAASFYAAAEEDPLLLERPAATTTTTTTAYRINVELCIAGEHDASDEMLQRRRRAASKRRRLLQASEHDSVTQGAEDAGLAPSAPAAEKLQLLHVTLHVLGRADGKGELSRVAQELVHLVEERTDEEVALRCAEFEAKGAEDLRMQGTGRREEVPAAVAGGPGARAWDADKARAQVREELLDRIDARKVDQALQGESASSTSVGVSPHRRERSHILLPHSPVTRLQTADTWVSRTC